MQKRIGFWFVALPFFSLFLSWCKFCKVELDLKSLPKMLLKYILTKFNMSIVPFNINI